MANQILTHAEHGALVMQAIADTLPLVPLAGVIARSLDMNDEQWKRGEITHAIWCDTYIALLNYATSHGIAEDVFDVKP